MLKTSTWSELSKLISTKRQRDSLQFHVSCFGLVILSGFVWTLTVRRYECIDGGIDRRRRLFLGSLWWLQCLGVLKFIFGSWWWLCWQWSCWCLFFSLQRIEGLASNVSRLKDSTTWGLVNSATKAENTWNSNGFPPSLLCFVNSLWSCSDASL